MMTVFPLNHDACLAACPVLSTQTGPTGTARLGKLRVRVRDHLHELGRAADVWRMVWLW